MLRRLLCWWGFHAAPNGLGATIAVYWACAHCRQLVPGERTEAARRR